MSKKVKLEHNYISTLLQPIPLTSTGEIAIGLAHEIDAEMGWIVIDRDINMKEERMFFHRKNANTVYVYSVNRDAPRFHDVGANVILDVISTVNYAIDTGFPQMYIYKKSNSSVIVTGGNFYINKEMVEIPQKEFNTFVNGVENNIYIKDKEYYVTNITHPELYLVGKVYVDIAGNVVDIDMARTLSVGDGLSKEDKDKLDSINPNEYEKINNKIAEIRTPENATHTNYPTEKAVADNLKNKVDKIEGKGLSEADFTKAEKDFLNGLKAIGLENLDFSQLHKLRTDIRAYALASNNESVSEKAIAGKLVDYVQKEVGKGLSTNDLTNDLFNLIKDYRDNKNKFLLLERDVINKVRPVKNAVIDKTPTERAVAEALEGKIDKVYGKGLSDVNFTQEMLDKLNSLGRHEKTPISAGTGIDVVDLGDKGWKVSTNILTQTDTYGGNYDIFPLYHGKTKYIDEQKYVILLDDMRSGFYGNATFKNGKNPSIKVFYNNPGEEGKIMIDTHIRILKSDGSVSEKHATYPYYFEIKHKHGMFLLKPQSFEGLDYSDAEALYLKVFRVGSYYTDKYGEEFNTILNDDDTLKGEIRFKSFYLNYEAIVSRDEDIRDKVVEKLKEEGKIEGYTGELLDTNCNKIADVKEGLIKSVEKKIDNSNGIKGLSVNYIFRNCSETRELLDVTTENHLTNVIYTFINDLYGCNLFTRNNSSDIIKELDKFSFTNIDKLTYNLDGNDSTAENIIEMIKALILTLKDNLNIGTNKCNGIKLSLVNNPVNYKLKVDGDKLYNLDVNSATLNQYKRFVFTLIMEVLGSGVFVKSTPVAIENKFEIIGGVESYILDNNTNNLKQLGNVLHTLIKDFKKINLLK